MIPNIGFDLENIVIKSIPNLSYKINETEDEIRMLSKLDGLEALKQTIKVMLSVERYEFEIYPRYYGFELSSIIGQPMWYAQSIVPQKIKDCLMVDDRILDVTDFVVNRDGRKLIVDFVVKTKLGNIEDELEVEV